MSSPRGIRVKINGSAARPLFKEAGALIVFMAVTLRVDFSIKYGTIKITLRGIIL